MSISSFTRFFSHSITSKTPKIFTLHFTTSSLADKFYTHLQKNPNNTERALNLIKAKLDTTCVNEVLNKCSLNNSQLGLRFFIWAGYQSKYRHSDYMYSKACKLFKIKQNPQVLFGLIEAYRLENCVVTVKTFKVVLNLCKQCSLADESLLLLRKMPEFGLRADASAYNIVIRLFCEKGEIDIAQKLMGEMGLIDLYPDLVTYTSIIKGFCELGRVDEACGSLKAMRGHGCLPNVVVYSAIVDGFCRFGSVDKALELIGEMEKEGSNSNPNVITYTSVIQSLCEKGRAMDAFIVLDKMEACGCAPNRVTISTFLKGLCMDGHVEEAYKLIDRVVGGGSISYDDCFSSLVLCLINVKKVKEAEALFRRILRSGMKPDGLACSVMIKELISLNRVIDGFYLYDEIERMGLLSAIDSDIYSILLFGLCQRGHSVEAEKLARSMLEKKIGLKHPYVEKVVEHLKKHGEMELVTKLASIGR